PVGPAVAGGQGGRQGAGGGVPGGGDCPAVIGEHHAPRQKALVHIVGHRGGYTAPRAGDGHGGRGIVQRVLVGGGQVIQPDGPALPALPAAIGDIDGLDRGSGGGQGGVDVLPAGEVQGGNHHAGGGPRDIGYGGGEGVARPVAIDPHTQEGLPLRDSQAGG